MARLNYKFGDILIYHSPYTNQDNIQDNICVYIREENRKAIVMFPEAEWAARVYPKTLRLKGGNDENTKDNRG